MEAIFGSRQVANTVIDVLSKYLPREVEKIMADLKTSDAKPENFMRFLAMSLKKRVTTSKAQQIMLEIKHLLARMVKVEFPAELKFVKNSETIGKIKVTNLCDVPLRVKVKLTQATRKFTSIICLPTDKMPRNEVTREFIIAPGMAHTFNFLFKADVMGVQDLNELKRKGSIDFDVKVEIKSHIDGIKFSGKFKVVMYKSYGLMESGP